MLLNTARVTIKCFQNSKTVRVSNLGSLIQVQKYSEWAHRRPVRIVNEEEILENAEAADGPHQYLDRSRMRPLRVKPKKFKAKKTIVTEVDTLHKEDGKINFTELKENDHLLTSLMMSVRSRKTRDRNSRIILEGHRLIADAILAGSIPEIIVFSRLSDVQKLPLPEVGVKLYKTPYRAIQTWTTLTTAPGVMAFCKIPNVESIEPSPDALPLTVICDNVREPGNLGSILRACAAVGCKKLILCKGCVDLWDSKVLRSAAGAHFRMPIFATKTWQEILRMIDRAASVYVADNNTVATDITEENRNLSDKYTEDVNIMENSENSPEIISKSGESNIANEDELFESIKNSSEFKNHHERQQDEKLAKKLINNIHVIPYYATDYTLNENIIIVGGETEGISLEALALVNERNGIRVNIPMTNGVDSLNTGMALGIIAFEIKRQCAIKESLRNENKTM